MSRTSASKPGMLTLRNAAENASTSPLTDDQIVATLRHGSGEASHVRAIFGDTTLASLAEAGRSNGIEIRTILAAYATARRDAGAANPELDLALDGGD